MQFVSAQSGVDDRPPPVPSVHFIFHGVLLCSPARRAGFALGTCRPSCNSLFALLLIFIVKNGDRLSQLAVSIKRKCLEFIDSLRGGVFSPQEVGFRAM